MCGPGDVDDGGPAAGDVVAERDERDDGAEDVDGHLHDVGPDDRGKAALKRVEQGERGDDADGKDVARADRYRDDDADGEDPDAFRGGAREQEEAGRDLVEDGAEATVDELVGGEHLAGEVARKKEGGDDDAAEQIPDHDLQEAEVARKRDAWDGDDGQRGGFGGDHGERDGPPRDGVAGEEVVLERPVLVGAVPAELKTEQCNRDEVDCDEDEVGGAQMMH